MVTGNGRQGVLVYGGPAALRCTLSHERLFLPVDEPLNRPKPRGCCPACASWPTRVGSRRRPTPLLSSRRRGARLRPPALADPSSARPPSRSSRTGGGAIRHPYRRWSTRPRVWCARMRRSRARGVRLAGTRRRRGQVSADGLSGRLHLGPVAGAPPGPVELRSDALTLTAGFRAAGPVHRRLRGHMRVVVSGVFGEPRPGRGSVVLDGVREATFLARTDVVRDSPPRAGAVPDMTRSRPLRRPALRARAGAPGLFDRCRLDLAASDDDRARSTEDLLAGPTATPPCRAALRRRRYAIICASGELPRPAGRVSGTFHPPGAAVHGGTGTSRWRSRRWPPPYAGADAARVRLLDGFREQMRDTRPGSTASPASWSLRT